MITVQGFENLSPTNQDTVLVELTTEALHGDFDQLSVLGSHGLNGQIRGSLCYIFSEPYTDWTHLISLHFSSEAIIFSKEVALDLYDEDTINLNLYSEKCHQNADFRAAKINHLDDFAHLWYLAFISLRVRKILERIQAQTHARFNEGDYLSLLCFFRYAGTDRSPRYQQRIDYLTGLSENGRQRIDITLHKIADAFANIFKDVPPAFDSPFSALYGNEPEASRVRIDEKPFTWTQLTGSGTYSLALKSFFVGMNLREWTGFFGLSGELDNQHPPMWVRDLELGLLLDVGLDPSTNQLVLTPWARNKPIASENMQNWIVNNRLGAWNLVLNYKAGDNPIVIDDQPKREDVVYRVPLGHNT